MLSLLLKIEKSIILTASWGLRRRTRYSPTPLQALLGVARVPQNIPEGANVDMMPESKRYSENNLWLNEPKRIRLTRFQFQ